MHASQTDNLWVASTSSRCRMFTCALNVGHQSLLDIYVCSLPSIPSPISSAYCWPQCGGGLTFQHSLGQVSLCLSASKYVWDLIGGVGDKRSTGVWTHWSSHIEVVCWLELSAVVGWLVEWMLKQNSIYYYYNTTCSTTFQTIFVYYNLSIITGWLLLACCCTYAALCIFFYMCVYE